MIKQKHFILLFLRQYSNKVGTYESQRKTVMVLGWRILGVYVMLECVGVVLKSTEDF